MWIRIIALLFAVALQAQDLVNINARVIDADDDSPVIFANVQILHHNMGTVTDEEGRFTLTIDEEFVDDMEVLEVSALGYQTRQITLRQLYSELERSDVLTLDALDKELSSTEFFVTDEIDGQQVGYVRSDEGPIQGARITVKGSLREAVTDHNGFFQIAATPFEILEVRALGMRLNQKSASPTDTLSVKLEPIGELLTEVRINGKNRKVDPYGRPTEVGKAFDASGFAISQITADQIPKYAANLDMVMMRLPFVLNRLTSDGIRKYWFPRGSGGSFASQGYPIVVLDGLIYRQGPGLIIPEVPVDEIVSITAIPGVMARIKYGGLGNNGAIEINSNVDEAVLDGNNEVERSSARLKGNIYSERAPDYRSGQFDSEALNELQAAASFDEAKSIYARQLEEGTGTSVRYYIDAGRYFRLWDRNFATKVLMNIAEIAPTNAKALRTLAFCLDEIEAVESARLVYQRIAMLEPSSAQSYRDLANSYKKAGELAKAFELYKFILANEAEGIAFDGVIKPAESELRGLLNTHKAKLAYQTVSNDLLDIRFKQDLRLVFEWNDPNEEFEIQFVNPDGRYYNWNHDLFSTKERMQAEVSQGFQMEEFVIDSSEAGQWRINVRPMGFSDGTESLNPTVLKYTIYRGYGTPQQTHKTRVINLSGLEGKVTIDRFTN